MATYTTQLRSIVESITGLDTSVGYNEINNVIEKARPNIFSFNYPIYDDNYKPVLETKIIKHFYTREIGEETYGLWKLRLDEKLNLIMPYYNQLYENTLTKYNVFTNIDYSENYEKTGKDERNKTDNSTTNSTSNGTDTTSGHVYSNDTPHGILDQVETGKYLTNAEFTANNSTTGDTTDTTANVTTNENVNTSENYIKNIVGNNGSKYQYEILKEIRETFINIDAMIIEELEPLFISLW